MEKSEILTKGRRYCKASTDAYSDVEMLEDLNLFQGELLIMVLEAQGYTNAGQGEAYTNLVDGTSLAEGDNGYNGEYAFPADMLRPTRIEVKYDGADSKPITIYDQSEHNYSEHEDVNDYFTEDQPHVRFMRDSIVLRPVPEDNVTGGLHIWYDKRQNDLVDDDDEPIIDKNFHRIYPLLLAQEFSLRNPDKTNNMWRAEINDLKRRIKKFYNNRLRYRKKVEPIEHDYS
jgi:hypothetical protein